MEYGLVVVWLVTYLALGLAGLPLSAALLERLPGRGASVAIPLSLTVVTVVVLWLGRISFGWPVLAAGLAVLAGLALYAGSRFDAEPDWPIAAETAVVFAAAFLFMVAVRAYDPAVHPILGEKFLDFGLLKSLLRSDALPPEDMWFANEPVAYYYGGHLVAALLTMMTDTPANYAYNLALAGFYGMVVTAAYGVGGAIADARDADRRTGGLWAAFFVGVASNLETPAMLVLAALPRDVAMPIARFFKGKKAPKFLKGAGEFGYFDASRVIQGTINEFPLFAWLNGDMHAHMMSTPFMLLAVALLFGYFRTPESAVGRRRLLLFGPLPVVAGLLGVVNTWSFPTVMGLTAIAVLFAPSDPVTLLPDAVEEFVAADGPEEPQDALVRELRRIAVAVPVAIGVELIAFVVALPFFVGPASTRSIAVLPDRSSLGGLLLVHGPFLLVTGLYLASKAQVDDDRAEALVLVALLVAVSTLLQAAAIGLFVPLILGGWALARSDADVSFEAVLVAGAVGLALVVEFVYVKEKAGPGRFNTVFKTYAQVWLLWAVAAGGMAASLLDTYSLRPGDIRDRTGATLDRAAVSKAVALRGAMALLVLSTTVYAGLALSAHFAGESMYSRYQTADDPTLNATQFAWEAHPHEAKAIFWMDRNIEGQPTIVTAAPGGYFWYPSQGKGASAPASLTGIPTVLGWFHEIGYRGREPFRTRRKDVRVIYTGTPAQQVRLLRKYEVEYVYFGPAERAKYGPLDYDVTIDDLPGVTLYKDWEYVNLYRVNQSALPETNSSSPPPDE